MKLIALVGRPNVGKSTLFNVLTRSRKALVEDTPGLTRDRNYAHVEMDDKSFMVVDTGGFEPTSDDDLLTQMRLQTTVAIEQADIIVFLGDGKTGINPSDHEIVRMLDQTGKRVFYVVNKIDSEKQEDLAYEFYALGVDLIYPVSAMTGYGMSELIDDLLHEIPGRNEGFEPAEDPVIRVAVVGRPNVGKSTLINLLLGEERLVANPQPGTTRDSIDAVVKHYGKEYLFIDTAGIRRRSRIVDRVEKYSVIKAFQSIDRAQLVLVMLDSTEQVTEQDARIAGYAFDRGRAVILILNKWDLVEKDSKTHQEYVISVRDSLKYLDHAPVLTMSALKGTRAPKIFGIIDDLVEMYEDYTDDVCEELGTNIKGGVKTRMGRWLYGMSIEGFEKWAKEAWPKSADERIAEVRRAYELDVRKKKIKEHLWELNGKETDEVEKLVEGYIAEKRKR